MKKETGQGLTFIFMLFFPLTIVPFLKILGIVYIFIILFSWGLLLSIISTTGTDNYYKRKKELKK